MRWICERSVPLQKRKRVLLSSFPKVTITCSDFHEHDIRYARRGVGAMDFVCFRSNDLLSRICVLFLGGSRETSTMFIFYLHLSGQQIIDSCYVVRLCKVCCFHAAIQGALVFLKVCI